MERTNELLETSTDASNEKATVFARAISVRYDWHQARVIVWLESGVEISFPSSLLSCLSRADLVDLREVAITSSGHGIYFPRLDTEIYLPGLFQSTLRNSP